MYYKSNEQRKAVHANMNGGKPSKRQNKLMEMLPEVCLSPPQTPKPEYTKVSEQKLAAVVGVSKEIAGIKVGVNASIEYSTSSGKQKR